MLKTNSDLKVYQIVVAQRLAQQVEKLCTQLQPIHDGKVKAEGLMIGFLYSLSFILEKPESAEAKDMIAALRTWGYLDKELP